MSNTYETSIAGIKKIAKDTFQVDLVRPHWFVFTPGQYVQIGLKNMKYKDAKGSSRVFSIASDPNSKIVTIITKQTNTGFKRSLFETIQGTTILLEGPFGTGVALSNNVHVNRVFIAKGIGVTPFLSVLRHAAHDVLSSKITLLYFYKTKKDAIYLNELIELSRTLKKFEFIQSTNIADVTIFEELVQRYRSHKETLWYVSGSPEFSSEVAHYLTLIGINELQLRGDSFVGY